MKDLTTGKPLLMPADLKLVEGVLARQPRALAKAITLAESTRPDHQARAGAVLDKLLPSTGKSIRLGISGAPGAGKSTFIEALGVHLIGLGKRVAVLAVDPSSAISGGSILGDKTRMERLCQEKDAFIRPSPSHGSLGGVAEKTREAMLICEAAGYDVVLIETVGVGQSETTVAGMSDMFVLVQLPNAGDDLQAIKKGIIELADIIVVNKADIDPKAAAIARGQISGALGLLRSASPHWRPPVMEASAATNKGIDAFWAEVEKYARVMAETGEFQARRRRQAVDWMWAMIDGGLRARFRQHPRVRRDLDPVVAAVAGGEQSPSAAAYQLLGYLDAPTPTPASAQMRAAETAM
ncbi:putative GTPase [Aquisphaera giovannonii]|uniref:Putative GTPase n=1 Tax=Aquisphaera giovannonii TaxID=406548 RepID=A0A5B9W3H7_9BACT|nr:methylmalonyl Co-A mutase-associated GTPase MeaB [Aquisphaera giovannonii]QEH35166.1 putative GTPase [Aquisphaera giovannonii]